MASLYPIIMSRIVRSLCLDPRKGSKKIPSWSGLFIKMARYLFNRIERKLEYSNELLRGMTSIGHVQRSTIMRLPFKQDKQIGKEEKNRKHNCNMTICLISAKKMLSQLDAFLGKQTLQNVLIFLQGELGSGRIL